MLLLLTFNVALAAPNCNELSQTARNLEFEMQNKTINPEECAKLKPSKELTEGALKIFNDYKCAKFSDIEARIKELENENTLLIGFEKLKADIKKNKSEIKVDEKSVKENQEAADKFIDALNTAQSLELILDSKDNKGNHLISILKQLPANQRSDLKGFKEVIKKFCDSKDKKDQTIIDVCHKDFAPGEIAFNELTLLLGNDIDAKKIENWKSSLDIKKKDNSKYSFNELFDDLKEVIPKINNKEKLNLTKKELKAIQSLPDFKNDNDLNRLFVTFDKVKSSNQDKLAFERFSTQINDLMDRQAFEMSQQIYIAALSYNKYLKDEKEVTACQNAKLDFIKYTQDCLFALKKVFDLPEIGGQEKADIERMIKIQDINFKYLKSLDPIRTCLETAYKNKTDLTQSKCLDEAINPKQLAIQDELNAMNDIRESFFKEHSSLNRFRQFAINNLTKMKCSIQRQPSEVEICDANGTQVQPTLIALTNDIIDIPVYMIQEGRDSDVADLCTEKLKNKDYKVLCSVSSKAENEEPQESKEEAEARRRAHKRKAEAYIAPTDPGHRNESSTATDLLGAGLGLLRQGLNAFNNTAPPPYTPQYAPTNYSGPRGMPISDQFLGQAYYQGGLGIYATTPGTQPYTSFGTYRSYQSTSPSLYFR